MRVRAKPRVAACPDPHIFRESPNGWRLSGDGGETDGLRCSTGLGAGSDGGEVEHMAEVREVLDEALKLAPDDRASVAVELLESLEAGPEES